MSRGLHETLAGCSRRGAPDIMSRERAGQVPSSLEVDLPSLRAAAVGLPHCREREAGTVAGVTTRLRLPTYGALAAEL